MTSTNGAAAHPHHALIAGAKTLIDKVEFDVNGTHGKGGNGGLISDETIRAAGDLRIILSRISEHPAPAENTEGPRDISSAPPMTDVLVWWPIVKFDENGDPTDEVIGGRWITSEDQGGYWIEPEVMTAIGDHMGDDHTYADMPSHWLPLPTPLFTAASEGSADE